VVKVDCMDEWLLWFGVTVVGAVTDCVSSQQRVKSNQMENRFQLIVPRRGAVMGPRSWSDDAVMPAVMRGEVM